MQKYRILQNYKVYSILDFPFL